MDAHTDPVEVGVGSSENTRRWTRFLRGWRLVLSLALIAAVAVVGLRVGYRDVFAIESGSMEPTLQPGEKVLVDVTARLPDLRRGDVVVFDGRGSFEPYAPVSGLDSLRRVVSFGQDRAVYIKRVIGLPGDRVTCCGADGRLSVNGVAVSEDYVMAGDAPSLMRFDVVVPQDSLWVLGDHRSASRDSRALLGAPGGGMVSGERVIGRATDIVWPWRERASLASTGEQ